MDDAHRVQEICAEKQLVHDALLEHEFIEELTKQYTIAIYNRN